MLLGRDEDAVVRVDHAPVGAAAAVRDPRSRAGAHHRLDRGDEPARRMTDDHRAIGGEVVDVRFPVRDDDHLVAAQLRAEQRAQPLLVPGRFRPERAPVLVLEIAQAQAQVGGERRQLATGAPRPDQAFATQQRAGAGQPAAPADLRDDDGDERDHGAEAGDEDDQIAPRVLAAFGDEAEVLQQHEVGDRPRLARHRMHADVDRPAFDAHDRRRQLGDVARFLAAEGRRIVVGVADEETARRAQADRDQALVLRRAIEERHQTTPLRIVDRLGDRIGQRVGDQLAAQVEVAREPAQRQAIHHRQSEVGAEPERDQERNQEPELEAERVHGAAMSQVSDSARAMAGHPTFVPMTLRWTRSREPCGRVVAIASRESRMKRPRLRGPGQRSHVGAAPAGDDIDAARPRPRIRYAERAGMRGAMTTTSPYCARWRSAWSISTSASIASAIGVARMPTQGS